MQFFFRDEEERQNCEAVRRLAEDFGLRLYHPNEEKAPWHVQARVNAPGGDFIVDFWPHKLKGRAEGFAVEGEDALRDEINRTLAEYAEPFDLIED